MDVFRSKLADLPASDIPVFQLGEVDCGFVIWVRAQRYGESVQQQLAESLAAYRTFLCSVRDQGFARLIVTSATLPTIYDGQLDGEVAHLRRKVRASYRERTDLTLEYNRQLEAICRVEGLEFADLTPALINPETRLLDERFRHPDLADHHLDPSSGGDVWVAAIQSTLARQAADRAI